MEDIVTRLVRAGIEPDWDVVRCIVGQEQMEQKRAEWMLACIERVGKA